LEKLTNPIFNKLKSTARFRSLSLEPSLIADMVKLLRVVCIMSLCPASSAVPTYAKAVIYKTRRDQQLSLAIVKGCDTTDDGEPEEADADEERACEHDAPILAVGSVCPLNGRVARQKVAVSARIAQRGVPFYTKIIESALHDKKMNPVWEKLILKEYFCAAGDCVVACLWRMLKESKIHGNICSLEAAKVWFIGGSATDCDAAFASERLDKELRE
jgi:hypothetical protein